jgi:hypothetical protein
MVNNSDFIALNDMGFFVNKFRKNVESSVDDLMLVVLLIASDWRK